ncbi:exo-alpha-sialidase [Verrucomicrobiaceae bacterium N1E253]|uniref:exo-alpha-sialidase n=1 Tax=Oceaniferula marina TaxID=2748318 RepID=A0A851GHQ7_9BACT|nr:sialidase family protein [Oceaniferula marina]NWK54150.1 exo-alpha-sialidase [Oceaniferula marina]
MKIFATALMCLVPLVVGAQEKKSKPTWKDYRAARDGMPYTRLAEGVEGQMIMKAGTMISDYNIQGTFQPSFTVAANGDYLVFTQGRIDSDADKAPKVLLMVRSRDGGKTWSPPTIIAKPKGSFFCVNSFTDSKTGQIHVLFKNNKAWQITSHDNGNTWSDWDSKDVSKGFGIGSEIWNQKRVNSNIFLGQAIKLANGEKNGRIVLGGIHKYNKVDKCPVAVWSDDQGVTWQHGEGVPDFTSHRGMSEPAVVELSDGRLMIITRDGERIKRRYSISQDFGQSWGPILKAEDLPAPGCFGSVCSATVEIDGKKQHVLLFASPANKKRRDGRVYYSLDDGKHWKNKALDKGLFSYSTITHVPETNADGSFVVCYTKGWHGSRGIYFVKLKLDWLFADEPKAPGPPDQASEIQLR